MTRFAVFLGLTFSIFTIAPAIGAGKFECPSPFKPNTPAKLEQVKGTLQYNLSKRTAVYTTASLLDNKDGTRYALPGSTGLASSSGKSQGIEFGLRHFF